MGLVLPMVGERKGCIAAWCKVRVLQAQIMRWPSGLLTPPFPSVSLPYHWAGRV